MANDTRLATRIRRPISPAGVVAAALCLVFPFAWQCVAPTLTGEPTTLLLTPPELAPSEAWPAEGIVVTERESAKVGDGRRIVAEFSWPETGRFSVTGLSSQPYASPVEIAIDGRSLSSVAFFQHSDARIARQRLATNVPLAAGTHEITLYGDKMYGRSLALELTPEADLDIARFLARSLMLAVLLALRAAFVARVRLSPRMRLAVASTGYATLCAGTLWWAGSDEDGDLNSLGVARTDTAADPESFRGYVALRVAPRSAARALCNRRAR